MVAVLFCLLFTRSPLRVQFYLNIDKSLSWMEPSSLYMVYALTHACHVLCPVVSRYRTPPIAFMSDMFLYAWECLKTGRIRICKLNFVNCSWGCCMCTKISRHWHCFFLRLSRRHERGYCFWGPGVAGWDCKIFLSTPPSISYNYFVLSRCFILNQLSDPYYKWMTKK